MTEENGPSRATEDAPETHVAAAQPYSVRLEFTGSGSEYFRIWIVNLLLTVCTLGLYYPWAKVRRLRYFYGNTLVDGQPLGFHGDPKQMLKGFLLVVALFASYSVAQQVSPIAAALAFVLLAALWPALWKSSMQFRLANTSWRGLRFQFAGALPGAYKAVAPFWVPLVLLIGLGAFWGVTQAGGEGAIMTGQAVWLGLAFMAAVFLGSIVLMPFLFWNLKRYQHNHYVLATQQSQFGVPLWGFYKLAFKLGGLGFVSLLVVMGVVLLGVSVLFSGGMSTPSNSWFGIGLLLIGVYAPIVAAMTSLKAIAAAMVQNLVWSNTASSHLRFQSDLEALGLMGLALKNFALTVFTLGLYWPFAAIATQRMRLQAVTVAFSLSPDELVLAALGKQGDTAGDAAGDILGIDIGV
jgi:uncharacterized membrane protein YjgN (DUF898 family)